MRLSRMDGVTGESPVHIPWLVCPVKNSAHCRPVNDESRHPSGFSSFPELPVENLLTHAALRDAYQLFPQPCIRHISLQTIWLIVDGRVVAFQVPRREYHRWVTAGGHPGGLYSESVTDEVPRSHHVA